MNRVYIIFLKMKGNFVLALVFVGMFSISLSRIDIPVDIAFIVDETGSIGSHWSKMKSVMQSIVNEFSIGLGSVQFSVTTYETNPPIIDFCFNPYTNHVSINEAIGNLAHTGGGLQTPYAVKYMRENVFKSTCGDRSHVQNVGILISDSQLVTDSADEAIIAINAGIAMIVIGVGITDPSSIEKWSSSPDLSFILTSTNNAEVSDAVATGISSLRFDVLVDVAFVVDVSGSTRSVLSIMKSAVVSIVNKFYIRPESVQFSLTTYNSPPQRKFCMNVHTDSTSINTAIGNAIQNGGSTSAGTAVKFMRENVFIETCGDRQNIPNVGILISDGQLIYDSSGEADLAISDGISMIVIGAGVADVSSIGKWSSSSDFSFVLNSTTIEDVASGVATAISSLHTDLQPPSDIMVNAVDTDTLTVSWSPGNAQDTFVVYLASDKSSSATCNEGSLISTSTVCTFDVTGNSGASHTVYVVSKSGNIESTSVPAIGNTNPLPPTNVTVSAVDTDTLLVTWSPVTTNNIQDTFVVYLASEKSSSATCNEGSLINTSTVCTFDVTGNPGASHTVYVVSKSGNSESTTVPAIGNTNPLPPTSVTVSAVDTDTLNVTWSPITTNNIQDTFVVYLASDRSSSATCNEGSLINTSTVCTFDVTGNPGASHTVYVVSKSGNSESTSVPAIGNTNPLPPTSVTVSAVDTDTLLVTWNPVTTNNIQDTFVVYLSSDLSSSATCNEDPLTSTSTLCSFDVTGDSGALYTVYVVSKSGNSESTYVSANGNTKPQQIGAITISSQTINMLILLAARPVNGVMEIPIVTSIPISNAISVLYNSTGDFYKITIGGLTAGTNYDVTITSKSGSETGTPRTSTIPTKPAPPTALQRKSATTSSMVVKWVAPVDGNYEHFTLVSNSVISSPIAKSVFEYTIVSLTAGKAYGVSVYTNSNGLQSDAIDGSFRIKPNEPQSIQVSAVTAITFTVKWDSPVGEVTGYSIDGINKAVNERVHTFSGREPGTLHTLALLAIADDLASEEVTVSVVTIPNPPRNIVIETTTNSSVIFNWTAPDQTAAVTGYRYTVLAADNSLSRNITTTELSVTETGLYAGQTYDITVWSYTQLGGHGAQESAQTVDASVTLVPNSPSNLRETNKNRTTIGIAWDSPPVGMFTEYQLIITDTTTGVLVLDSVTIAKGSESYEQTGLLASRTYKFSVVTVSSSEISAPSEIGITTDSPSIPDLTISEASSTSIDCSWAPAQDEEATTAQVQVLNTSNEVGIASYSDGTSEHTFNGLTPGQYYTVNITLTVDGAETSTTKHIVLSPLEVNNFTITVINETDVELMWDIDSSSYQDEFVIDNGVKTYIENYNSGTSKTSSISGLLAGGWYQFTIHAKVTHNGLSKISPDTSNTVTTWPRAVKTLTAVADDHGNVTLTWEPEINSNQTSYRIWYETDDVAPTLHYPYAVHSTALSHVIHYLYPGTEYTFRIKTQSGAVESAIDVSATSRLFPLAPPTLTIFTTTTDMSLSWTTPLSVITHYRLEYRVTGTTAWTDLALDGTETSQTISGLVPGQNYTIIMLSLSHGKESRTFANEEATLVPVMTAILSEAVGQTRPDEVVIKYTEETGIGVFDQYIFNINGVSSPVTKLNTDTDRVVRFSGLSPGTLYIVTARTRSGDQSSQTKNLVVLTLPHPPRDIQVGAATTTTVTFSWTEPDETSPGTGYRYTVTVSSDGSQVRNTSTPALTVMESGLYSGQTYDIQVYAYITSGQHTKESSQSINTTVTLVPKSVSIDSTSTTTTTASIIWSPGGNSIQNEYTLELYNNDTSSTSDVSTESSTMKEYTTLNSGSLYIIRIRAKSDTVESVETEASFVTKPAAVVDISFTNVNTSTLEFTWMIGPTRKESVTITLEDATDDIFANITVGDVTDNMFTFSSLHPGHQYRIYISVTSHGVSSSWYAESDNTVPLPPEDVEVSATDTDSLEVTWTPQTDDQNRQDEFELYLDSAFSSQVVCNGPIDSSSTSCTFDVTDNPGAEYSIYIVSIAGVRRSGATMAVGNTKPRAISGTGVQTYGINHLVVLASAPSQSNVSEIVVSVTPTTNNITYTKNVDNDYEITINGLAAGTLHVITITTKSGKELGAPVSTNVSTKPATPGQLSRTGATTQSLTIAWTAPEGIVQYYRIYTGSGYDQTIDNSQLSHEITNLTAGVSYYVSVEAYSNNLRSFPSTGNFRSKPNGPANIRFSSVFETSFHVHWDAPLDGEVTNYTVEVVTVTNPVNKGAAETSHVFNMLAPATQYQVKVVSKADDLPSTPATAFVVLLPNPPRALQLNDKTNDSIEFSWMKPLQTVNVTGYKYNITDSYNNVVHVDDVTDTAVVYSSLYAGKTYSVEVTSYIDTTVTNFEYLESRSFVAAEFTLYPNPPYKVVETHKSTTNISVSWELPLNTIYDGLRYKVYRVGDTNFEIENVTIATTTVTLLSLTAGAMYDFIIWSWVEDVSGNELKSSLLELPFTMVPDPPSNFHEDGKTRTTVALAWSTPPSTGVFDEYRLTVIEVSTNVNIYDDYNLGKQLTSYTVSGLNAGATYIFEIVSQSGEERSSIVSLLSTTVSLTEPELQISAASPTMLICSWDPAQGETPESYTLVRLDRHGNLSNLTLGNETETYTFDNLTPGEYYKVTLTLTLDGGTSYMNKSVVLPPLPVTNFASSSDSSEKVTLRWDVDQTSYQSEFVIQYNQTVITVMYVPGESGIYNVTSLFPGNGYNFTIYAKSIHGTQSNTGASVWVTTTTSPLQVDSFNAVADTHDTVKLDWTASTNSYQTGFHIRYESTLHNPGEVTDNITVQGDVEERDISSLYPGDEVKFFIKTVSGSVESDSEIEAVARLYPLSPVSINYTSRVSEVDVQWYEPRSYLTGYVLEYEKKDTTDTVTMNLTKDETMYTIINLEPGHSYTIRIFGISGDMYSKTERMVTTNLYPESPSGLSRRSATTSSLTVTWSAPTGSVNEYIISLPNGYEQNIDGDIPVLEYTITNLTAGVRYTVSIVSVSNEQRSESISTNMRSMPSIPININIDHVNETSFHISWDAPDVGEVTGYTITLGSESYEKQTRETSHLFDELSPGSKYEIELKSKADDLDSEIVMTGVVLVPKPPRNIQVDDRTNQKMTLSWIAPDQLEQVTGYLYKITDESDNVIKQGSTTERNMQELGLEAGETYSVNIMSYINSSVSKFEHVVSTSMDSIQLTLHPNPPNQVRQIYETTTSIHITWSAPTKLQYEGYKYISNIPNTDTTPEVMTLSKDKVELTILSLEQGITYEFQIWSYLEGVSGDELKSVRVMLNITTDTDKCLSSPCQQGGSCRNFREKFECTCIEPWAGISCEIEIKRDPIISSVRPDFGPADGGTNMTLTGKNLDVVNDVTIIIGDILDCITVFKNATHAIANTIQVDENNKTLVDKALPITVKLSGGKIYSTAQTFTYKGNPKVDSIQPLTTLRSGGTNLTVSGDKLDSVAQSYLVITMRLTYEVPGSNQVYINETKFQSPCIIENSEKMVCRTPKFDIPAGFADYEVKVETNSRKRSIHEETEYVNHVRIKRQAPSGSEDDNTIDFYISLKMDGVQKYENLSESLSNYSTLNVVYSDPTFDFGEAGADAEREFEPGEPLLFKGSSLDVAVTASDYIIEIGKSICSDLDLTANALSCYPPDRKPELKDDNFNPQPRILINIGLYIQHDVGTLRYPETTPLHIIIPVALLIPIVTIVLISAICMVRRRKRRQRRGDQFRYLDKANKARFPKNPADYSRWHRGYSRNRYFSSPERQELPTKNQLDPVHVQSFHVHNSRPRNIDSDRKVMEWKDHQGGDDYLQEERPLWRQGFNNDQRDEWDRLRSVNVPRRLPRHDNFDGRDSGQQDYRYQVQDPYAYRYHEVNPFR